jgi:hypothetical protein
VIPDGVSALNNFADELGMPCNFFADHKEGRAGVVAVEQIEHAWRRGGIRTVVDGQPDLASIGAEMADRRTEAAGSRHEKLPDQPRRWAKKQDHRRCRVLQRKKNDRQDFGRTDIRDPKAKGARAAKTAVGWRRHETNEENGSAWVRAHSNASLGNDGLAGLRGGGQRAPE